MSARKEEFYMPEDVRIGVFVCHCGLNIAGVVDVEAVTELSLIHI